jgi:hypothetical protein
MRLSVTRTEDRYLKGEFRIALSPFAVLRPIIQDTLVKIKALLSVNLSRPPKTPVENT